MAAGPDADIRLGQPSEGRISRILLSLPAIMAPCLTPALTSFLAQLEPHVSIILVTHAAMEREARGLLSDSRPGGGELLLVDDGADISLWSQDACLVGADRGIACLLLAADAPAGRRDLFERIAALCGLPLRFGSGLPDGGNLLYAPDAVLLGGDQWPGDGTAQRLLSGHGQRAIRVASRLPVPAERVRPIELAGQPWREFFHHGNSDGSCQPVFHIDMFVTPAGRGPDGRTRLVVGDPALAARLLGSAPRPQGLTPIFDDIAAQLDSAGFAVVRNPLPIIYCDGLEKHERRWYFASGNNAVVQDSAAHGRMVWLPLYGHGNWPELAACDEANAKLWEEFGFDVRRVAECQPLAENFGGLNCMVKVLQRI